MIRTLIGAALVALSATAASAITQISTNCGTVDVSTCGGASINLAQNDTEWLFYGVTADDAGSLTIDTFTAPYWSSGSTKADIFFQISNVSGSYPGDYGATLTWGLSSFDLTPQGTGLGLSGAWFGFANTDPNNVNLVLSWYGLNGGELISLRVSAVPLPAGGLLLLTALGALGIARRRRSAEPALA